MPDAYMIEQINKAIYTHGFWKQKLRAAIINGSQELTPEIAENVTMCEFGAWLDGPMIPDEARATSSFELVRRLHSEFHACASQVLARGRDINASEAHILLAGECNDRSQVLITALTKWKTELTEMSAA